MSLKAVSLYWDYAKSFTKSNWKYFAAFSLGSLLSLVSSFVFTKKLLGMNTTALFGKIYFKYQMSKYRNLLKYDGWSYQPPIRPSTEAMVMDSIFRNSPKAPKDAKRDLFQDKNSKFYWKKSVQNFNATLKEYKIPSFMKKPSKLLISSDSNFELNAYLYEYPGCSLKSGIIYYIHGGAFYLSAHNEIDQTLCTIMQYTSLPVLSIEYQLLPHCDGIPNQVNQCIDGYKYILNTLKINNNNIFIMGASAGGSLSLLTLQKINRLSLPKPCGGILISPATDLTAGLIKNTIDIDRIQGAMISYAPDFNCWMFPSKDDREMYGNDELKILSLPTYSPINGNFNGLPSLYLSASLNESLIGDSKALLKKCIEANVDVQYKWDEVLPHVTVCFSPFVPEARDSLILITEWINKKIKN